MAGLNIDEGPILRGREWDVSGFGILDMRVEVQDTPYQRYVTVTYEAKKNADPFYGTVDQPTIVFVRTFPVQMPEQDCVRFAVRDAVWHEVDEWLRDDKGNLVTNPHPPGS